ncbi:MAG: electron transport complex subunit RsxC [Candidatus Hydrogenedentes bacterium]|nr:electron transport complex subunit RsxC [Candidatus Hydrogenedentota bacterium]
MLLSSLRGNKTFSHGIHPPENKEATEGQSIRRLPFAPVLIVPLSQHTGAPAKPIVRAGQEVVRGEPIAEAAGFVSVPMHAPATGVVERVGLARDARGDMSPAIVIRPYPAASQHILYGAEVDIESLSREELIRAVQATGVVGLGGAAFPTHVKLSLPEGKSVDTIIVNGCECEPYLTTDHRVMIETPEDIYKGARIVMRAMGAQRVIVAVETNKPDAAERLCASLPTGQPFSVEVCETKYPQGAEKMLIKALVNREVPSGGLPLDVGTAVFNVATLAQIGNLLPKRQGLIERVVTVTGPGVRKPGNYLMALGTPLRFVLNECGYRGDNVTQIILGGPMMGTAVASPDIPVTKGVTGILVLTKEDLPGVDGRKVYACIRCGTCVRSCPMHLNPSELGLLARKREYAEMVDRYHLMDCFECGCCSYVCPSNIPLVQYFRIAKAVSRKRKANA